MNIKRKYINGLPQWNAKNNMLLCIVYDSHDRIGIIVFPYGG